MDAHGCTFCCIILFVQIFSQCENPDRDVRSEGTMSGNVLLSKSLQNHAISSIIQLSIQFLKNLATHGNFSV